MGLIIQLQPQTPQPPPIIRTAYPINGNGTEDIEAGKEGISSRLPETDESETYEQAAARIALKYGALERHAQYIVDGSMPSLVVSGPPGMSKTFTLERVLKRSPRQKHDGLTPVEDATLWYDQIKGGCTAPGLYHAFWNMRKGGLVLIDDCDSVFEDIEAINLIKISTDTTEERWLSWRKRADWLYQHQIEKTFKFEGHVAFLTNIDFEKRIQKSNKDTEHFKALIDRAEYLCLTLRTQRDFMIRIRTVIDEEQVLAKAPFGFKPDQIETLLSFLEEHKMRFYNLSMRLVISIARKMVVNPDTWRQDVEATKMKTNL